MLYKNKKNDEIDSIVANNCNNVDIPIIVYNNTNILLLGSNYY